MKSTAVSDSSAFLANPPGGAGGGSSDHQVSVLRGGEVVLHVNQRPPRARVDRDASHGA